MIINFSIFRARRSTPAAIAAARASVAARPLRLACRWIADPAGGKPRAVWASDATGDPSARQANPGRLSIAA